MELQLFHIFRNTPLGRETLLQSAYFCKSVGVRPMLYIPKSTKFLMYFENDVVQVDLDSSYLTASETARANAEMLLEQQGVAAEFFKPKHYTASTLPDIPTDFDFMCCPRSISDLSSKIGLGYIGPRVRRIVQAARFPVLITSPVYKPWKSVAIFFGGSVNAVNAFKLGVRVSRATGAPLRMYTQPGNRDRSEYERILEGENLMQELKDRVEDWIFFDNGSFEDHLYDVPHDALVVLGAYGHGLIKDIVFGSKMEKIQSVISNNLLIVGPRYTAGY
ncbi:MAG: universal stress protein [Desulfobacteraceae bacterium]|nr:universal stress protein [Desulfobacteraceae bacterium]